MPLRVSWVVFAETTVKHLPVMGFRHLSRGAIDEERDLDEASILVGLGVSSGEAGIMSFFEHKIIHKHKTWWSRRRNGSRHMLCTAGYSQHHRSCRSLKNRGQTGLFPFDHYKTLMI